PEVFATDDLLVKKKLLQAMLAAVIVQGRALRAWQANSALYPLLNSTPLFAEERVCLYGSDGGQAICKHSVALLPPPLKEPL
ncbi:MAG: hypothetical protein D6743_15630, partial [Calditrichaeota bacterium]